MNLDRQLLAGEQIVPRQHQCYPDHGLPEAQDRSSDRQSKDPCLVLYSESLGDAGKTIVFLHGIAGSTRYWTPRVEPLAAQYRLLFVDLLGYGKSAKPWTKYTVERHVEEVFQVVRSQQSFTLVGHSFGAIVATAFRARYPHLVSRLILISLPYFGDKDAAIKYFRQSRTADRYVATNIAFAAIACMMTRWILRWFLPFVLRDMPIEVVRDLTRHTWRSYTSSLWDGVYGHDLLADVRTIDCDFPVVCLHGSADKTAPLFGVQQLLLGHPRWQLRILYGADHHPLLRDPRWCLNEIERAMRA